MPRPAHDSEEQGVNGQGPQPETMGGSSTGREPWEAGSVYLWLPFRKGPVSVIHRYTLLYISILRDYLGNFSICVKSRL